nr:MAG TPA: hypothetical protein [Caudoviricetes sp.]
MDFYGCMIARGFNPRTTMHPFYFVRKEGNRGKSD